MKKDYIIKRHSRPIPTPPRNQPIIHRQIANSNTDTDTDNKDTSKFDQTPFNGGSVRNERGKIFLLGFLNTV